jgi:HAD superfamily hydrolase (TIGR01509 family)
VSPATATTISALLAAARYVLLDFDGPVCSIFAGRAAPLVAEEIANVIRGLGHSVPSEVLAHGDPLDVLRCAGQVDEALATHVERALRAAELVAAETAQPTSGAADFLDACHQTGRAVAIVSNNSAPAVVRYLDRTGLAPLVAHVEGRDATSPTLMKPHPILLHRALRALDAKSESAVLIGDSQTDMEAAQAAGVSMIGYANRAGKAEILAASGAKAIVGSMADLANVAICTPRPS